MPPRTTRTYGTKKAATTTVNSRIFGKVSISPPKAQTENSNQQSSRKNQISCERESCCRSPQRHVTKESMTEALSIEDLTEQLSNARLDDASHRDHEPPLYRKKSSVPLLDRASHPSNRPGSPCRTPRRHAMKESTVVDLTKQLSEANLDQHSSEDEGSTIEVWVPVSAETSAKKVDPPLNLSILDPLIDAYKRDSDIDLQLENWDDIVPQDCSVVKIAEASFSEVYRITTNNETSIIKILPLKVPYDSPSLERTYAQAISEVVPEIRIMNALTVIPGFVTFKGAYLAMGPPAEKFIEAWTNYIEEYEFSEFEHPAMYGEHATFLAIELGDAGDVLDEVNVNTVDQAWDILLGVVIALTRAEALYEFEHRDLHENNICIYQYPISPRKQSKKQGSPIFGRSGIEVTIIDYGLSRAKLNQEEITFKDLELDLELFRGPDGQRQFDAYRRMRTHLLNGTHTHLKSSFHTPSSSHTLVSKKLSWSSHLPYTNVIWLSYILRYLETQLKTNITTNLQPKPNTNTTRSKPTKHTKEKFKFTKQENAREADFNIWLAETKSLKTCFDFRTKPENGAFESAKDVLEFCLDMGWVNLEQIVEVEEGSFFER